MLNVLMQSISSKLMLQNQSNSNCKVQIYDIFSRRDLNNSTTIYDPTNAYSLSQVVCLRKILKYVKSLISLCQKDKHMYIE